MVQEYFGDENSLDGTPRTMSRDELLKNLRSNDEDLKRRAIRCLFDTRHMREREVMEKVQSKNPKKILSMLSPEITDAIYQKRKSEDPLIDTEIVQAVLDIILNNEMNDFQAGLMGLLLAESDTKGLLLDLLKFAQKYKSVHKDTHDYLYFDRTENFDRAEDRDWIESFDQQVVRYNYCLERNELLGILLTKDKRRLGEVYRCLLRSYQIDREVVGILIDHTYDPSIFKEHGDDIIACLCKVLCKAKSIYILDGIIYTAKKERGSISGKEEIIERNPFEMTQNEMMESLQSNDRKLTRLALKYVRRHKPKDPSWHHRFDREVLNLLYNTDEKLFKGLSYSIMLHLLYYTANPKKIFLELVRIAQKLAISEPDNRNIHGRIYRDLRMMQSWDKKVLYYNHMKRDDVLEILQTKDMDRLGRAYYHLLTSIDYDKEVTLAIYDHIYDPEIYKEYELEIISCLIRAGSTIVMDNLMDFARMERGIS